jgi:hypothetical protein
MDYTVIAQKDDAGRPVEGAFEAVKRDDRRIGTRGWWGGSAMMSEAAALREAGRRNGGQSHRAEVASADGGRSEEPDTRISSRALRRPIVGVYLAGKRSSRACDLILRLHLTPQRARGGAWEGATLCQTPGDRCDRLLKVGPRRVATLEHNQAHVMHMALEPLDCSHVPCPRRRRRQDRSATHGRPRSSIQRLRDRPPARSGPA